MEPEITKEIIGKGSGVFNSLFGESFSVGSGIVADQLKSRQFKNQVKIFQQTQKWLQDNNIKTITPNLKVLFPLLTFASLEENEVLQDKWSKLTLEIVTKTGQDAFFQNCAETLNKMSVEDVEILTGIYTILEHDIKLHKNNFGLPLGSKSTTISTTGSIENLYGENRVYLRLNDLVLSIASCAEHLKLEKDYFYNSISNLIQIGVLIFTPHSSSQQKGLFGTTVNRLTNQVSTIHNFSFALTPFGEDFIKAVGIVESDPAT